MGRTSHISNKEVFGRLKEKPLVIVAKSQRTERFKSRNGARYPNRLDKLPISTFLSFCGGMRTLFLVQESILHLSCLYKVLDTNGVLFAPVNTMHNIFSHTRVVTRACQFLAVISFFVSAPVLAAPVEDGYSSGIANELSYQNGDSLEHRVTEDELRNRLIQEKYRTAILQERAKQRRLMEEEELNRQEQRVRDVTAERYSEEADYRKQSNEIDLFNDVVNAIGNIAAQASFVGNLGRRNGW